MSQETKQKEDREYRMFTMWLLKDLWKCKRCDARFQLFFKSHYGLKEKNY